MNVEKIEVNGVVFYNFTEICKISYRHKKSISQSVRDMPKCMVYVNGRGRHSRTFLSKEGLFLWLNTKRNIDQDVRELINSILEIKDQNTHSASFESVFFDILISFLKEIDKSLIIERQKNILNYTVDLCINNKLIIEFNERGHDNSVDYDKKREEDLKDKLYYVINIDSNVSYGKSIAEIYKTLLIKNI